jgi:flavodoxin
MLLPRRLEMAGSRILVVYYRSGTTRKIAEALSEALTCDPEEIVEDTSRSGFFGYMLASRK